jgi:hypothetical protein
MESATVKGRGDPVTLDPQFRVETFARPVDK